MIIIYQKTPISVLKATMLCRLYNGIPVIETSKFIVSDKTLNCNALSLNQVRKEYQQAFGPLGWLDTPKAASIATGIYYALRFKADNTTELVLKVIMQVLQKGPDYCLSRVSPEARTMFNRARRVSMEIHRAYGFLRLCPVNFDNREIMVARGNFENEIHDIVIRYFTKRNKNMTLYLIDGDIGYHLCDNKLSAVPVHELPFPIPDDDFQKYWQTYYNSQFIENRKNLSLARKHIPKKLWSWVPESSNLK